MSLPVFPESDLERPRDVQQLLGDCWALLYGGRAQVAGVVSGYLDLYAQVLQTQREAQACASRFELPLFHTELWALRQLKLSERTVDRASRLKFGDGAVFGAQTSGITYLYGQEMRRPRVSWTLSDPVAEVLVICDRPYEPRLLLVQGVDFWFDARTQRLTFLEDPTESGFLRATTLWDGETATDTVYNIWLHHAQIDREFLFRHFGYVLGLRVSSTEASRRLVNALLDSSLVGSSVWQAREALAAMLGLPLVLTDGETVEHVETGPGRQFVATDQALYLLPDADTPTVAAGDVLRRGDTLSTALQFFSLRRGELPDDLPALTLGEDLLGPGYTAPLTFENALRPVIRGAAGVELTIAGRTEDVSRFWTLVRAREASQGVTLAHSLRTSTRYGTFGATADGIPNELNPAAFVCAEILRYHTTLAVARLSQAGLRDLSNGLDALRHILPPQSSMYVVAQLAEIIDTDEPSDPDQPPVYGVYPGGLEELDEFDEDESLLRIRPASRTCHGF